MPYRKINLKAFVESLSPEQRSELHGVLNEGAASAGGRARAEKLTPERRSEISRKAAAARWSRSE